MYRFVILCFLAFALKEALGQTTEVSKCTRSIGNLPINAHVEGCLKPPCVLHKLEDLVIHVNFEAPYLIHNMTTKALAILDLIGPIAMIYDLGPNAFTCDFLTNTHCPIQKNEVVEYTLKIPIEPFLPSGISTTIEFRVEDENDQSVWCIRLPITIAQPRSQAIINQRI